MLFLSTEWTHRDGALITQNIKAEICDNSFNAEKINSLQFYKWRKVMMIIIWSPWIIYRDMNSRHFLRMVLLSRVNCFCSQNPRYLYINVQHCIPVEALELSCTHGFRKAVLPRLKWIVSIAQKPSHYCNHLITSCGQKTCLYLQFMKIIYLFFAIWTSLNEAKQWSVRCPFDYLCVKMGYFFYKSAYFGI